MIKNLKTKLCCALAAASLLQPAMAQFVISDAGSTTPTPGANDQYNFIPASLQGNDGLNYYWDAGNPAGQTFTTGPNAGGYTLTNLFIRTAGGGGGGSVTWSTAQFFALRFYSVTAPNDGNGNPTAATPIVTNIVFGQLNAQYDWIRFSGLGVKLNPNSVYAYTLTTTNVNDWEQLANCNTNPYAGGQICTIPQGGGTVQYGGTGNSDAIFLAGLALGSVTGGTPAFTDAGLVTPTPGPNDIYQLTPGVFAGQNDYTLNYYWDSNPGQTFTTPAGAKPWVLTNLFIQTAGGGGGGELNAQAFVLNIYSVTNNGTNATLIYSNSYSSQLAAEGDWIQCSGMNVVLQPNKQYAYGFNRGANGSWEHMADNDFEPYSGGKICLLPQVSGKINYGSQTATAFSDAGFDVGLTPLLVSPNQPTYTPNVNPIYAGTPVTLNEVASGNGLSYQWQTDGGSGGTLTNIPGATKVNLPVNTTRFADGTYTYDVIVTTTDNGGVSVTSPTVALTVTDPSAPILTTDISSSPDISSSTTSYVGLNQSFSASFIGTLPISYQWYVATDGAGDGATPISSAVNPSATNATLNLTNLQLGNSGYYAVVAANTISPTASSSWAQLTVQPAAQMLIQWQPPVTFNGLDVGKILTNTLPGKFFEAAFFGPTATNISVELNGATYTFYTNGNTVSVSGYLGQSYGAWLVGGNTTGDTNLDSVLDQFVWDSNVGTHTITLHNLIVGSNYCVQIFALDDRAAGVGRDTDFQDPAQNADVSATFGLPDNKYVVGTFTAQSTDVAIQQNLLPGGSGNTGPIIVGTVGWAPAPLFMTQPASLGTFPGRAVQFSASADATPAPAYRWQISTDGGNTYANLTDGAFNGTTISGSTNNTLTISNVTLAANGWMVQNTATNAAGGVASSPATLTVTPAPALSGPYSTSLLKLNPVAYWPLNETTDPSSGSAGVYEVAGMRDGLYGSASQNGFDGILGPQPADGYPEFTTGQGALSVTANVANSWAIVPGLGFNTNTVTITMWVNPNGTQAANSGLLMNRDTTYGSGGGFCLDGTGANLGYNWNNDSFTWGVSGPALPIGVWSFVALVVSPSSVSFYLYNTNNGTLTSSTVAHAHANMSWGGTVAPDPQVRIGCDNLVSRTFNGTIDEVAVFNYSLSSNQVAYAAGVSTTLVNTDPATANFKATVSGRTLNFTWAADHQGWQLYTNAVGLTATNSWYPVPGSANGSSQSIPVNRAQPGVFFQLRYP